MDTLLPTMDMPLPGGYAVMDMFLSTVDMLPPATNMLLSTIVDTSRVTEGYARRTHLSQYNQQYNRTGLFSFKKAKT